MRLPRWMRRRSTVYRVAQIGLASVVVFMVVTVLKGVTKGVEQSPKVKVEHEKTAEPAIGQVGVDKLPEIQVDIMKVDNPSAQYQNLPKKDWHDYAAMEADEKRKGPGEGGQPVKLPDDEETKKKQDAMYRVNGFDAMASDLISVERSVKDVRAANCRKRQYINKLPTVAVIFPSHNEHNSTLLRSIYSIINRSPKHLLREIIVVDDASTKDFLKKPLDDYLAKTGLDKIVKIVRTEKREGLIRARQIGATHSTADVMIFLDSHSEANYNWIPPLVEPIALDYRTVVCPFVDVVDCDTFEYRPQDEGARGSFDWEFNYKRLPRVDKAEHTDPSEPFESPVMAGGYFAISRKWFWELGGYDEGLDIWGGEQYELSFKVWQCHGRMVDSPCSRVGHIYRCKYVPFPNPNVGDFISRNYRRVAEVWMDEYAEHLYKRRTSLKTTDPGDLTKQKAVRERHKCKSFDWFMKNVAFDQDKFYPAVEPPDGANGLIKSKADPLKCIDTMYKGKEEVFGLSQCGSGSEQRLRLSFWQDIRPGDRSMCFDVSKSSRKTPVVMFPCHGMQGNQWWKYKQDTLQLFHPVSHQCLEAEVHSNKIYMEPCDPNKQSQKWQWDNADWSVMDKWKDDK